MKSDGRVRICGDYKVTVNQAAKLEKYPLPCIEELFASLAGGKLFTTLDLSHAYIQVPLDEHSCRVYTNSTTSILLRDQHNRARPGTSRVFVFVQSFSISSVVYWL